MNPGRLFWKILLALWGSLLLGVILTGLLADALRPERSEPPLPLPLSAAAAILKQGGPEAFMVYADELQQHMPGLRLHAIDAGNRDLFGHPVDSAVLSGARRSTPSVHAGPTLFASAPSGVTYLLYLEHVQVTPSGPGGPDQPGGPGPGRPPHGPPWLAFAGALLASLAGSAVLAWYLAKPIRHLRQALQSLAAGKLDTRVHARMGKRRDELADLGQDFDRMSQQLQNLMQSQQRLLHDVSHEFRSPLARLQAAIGLARQKPERTIQSLDRMELEIHRLDQLVGELLHLARLENDTTHGRETFDFNELLAGIIDDAAFEAAAMGKQIHFQNRPPGAGLLQELFLQGDGTLIHRAIENVVRNALYHSAAGSCIDMRMYLEAGALNLCISDQGPGVPEAELAKIFEPFYRSESASMSSKGFGLGLAIAKRAILAHKGSITARNRDGGGLEVHIRLPLTNDTPGV